MKTTVRIATRKSPLALWQANYVKDNIALHHPQVEVELLTMLTNADKLLATPLNKIGGKALFVKELETAILEHQADIAVHSIKDMPGELPNGLILGIVCKREDPRDVFISNKYQSLKELPKNANVGTSSLRRTAQLRVLRPDLNIIPLRGNVGTRLERLGTGKFDAIILAAAGMKRLGLTSKIKYYFPISEMLPAAGQGAIGVELRHKDQKLFSLLSFLEDSSTRQAVLAERIVVSRLGGSCQFPIAAHASIQYDQLTLEALVADTNGQKVLKKSRSGPLDYAEEIGITVVEDLIAEGALELLAAVQADNEGSEY